MRRPRSDPAGDWIGYDVATLVHRHRRDRVDRLGRRRALRRLGNDVLPLNSKNYAEAVGRPADVLVNCNGNTFRFKANRDPHWDFQASVASVERSLFDFPVELYIYVSTIDVYPVLDDPERNREDSPIDPSLIDNYGFHKYLAERLVERYSRRSAILRCGTAIGPGLKKGPLFDLLNGQPLFMSGESTLSLIDTPRVAEAVSAVVAEWPSRAVINLTGTGPAKVAELAASTGRPWPIAPGAEAKVHRYDINNARLRAMMDLPSSLEIGRAFIAEMLRVARRRIRRPPPPIEAIPGRVDPGGPPAIESSSSPISPLIRVCHGFPIRCLRGGWMWEGRPPTRTEFRRSWPECMHSRYQRECDRNCQVRPDAVRRAGRG